MDRPTVTLACAQSLDGKLATADGNSQWISGQETLELAHRLRAEHSAVLVGIGTVIADDPQLTCRLVKGNSPARIVLDSNLRLPEDCNLARTAGNPDTIVFSAEDAPKNREDRLAAHSVTVQRVARDPAGRLDLALVLRRLNSLGFSSLLVEGGAGVITSFVRHGFWDRTVAVIAPILIGTGIATVGDIGPVSLPGLTRHATVSLEKAGKDVVWVLENSERRDG